jgi:hypothetical protein
MFVRAALGDAQTWQKYPGKLRKGTAMWLGRMLVTTYSGGRVRVTRYQAERPTRSEVEAKIMTYMGVMVVGLDKPDSGGRVAFDLVILQNVQSKPGYMIGAQLEETIIDILPEDDVETPCALPRTIII